MANVPIIKGLPLPSLFVELMQDGRWRHPGDDLLGRLIPFLREPVDFLDTIDSITRESTGLAKFLNDQKLEELFNIKRSGTTGHLISLPWLAEDLSILIAVNRVPGDDIAIALDYRLDRADPRVVASDFYDVPHKCLWKEVAPSFSDFVKRLGI